LEKINEIYPNEVAVSARGMELDGREPYDNKVTIFLQQKVI